MSAAYAFPGAAAMAYARTSGRMLARGLRGRHDAAVQAGYREVARQLAARARGDAGLAVRLPSGTTLAELVR